MRVPKWPRSINDHSIFNGLPRGGNPPVIPVIEPYIPTPKPDEVRYRTKTYGRRDKMEARRARYTAIGRGMRSTAIPQHLWNALYMGGYSDFDGDELERIGVPPGNCYSVDWDEWEVKHKYYNTHPHKYFIASMIEVIKYGRIDCCDPVYIVDLDFDKGIKIAEPTLREVLNNGRTCDCVLGLSLVRPSFTPNINQIDLAKEIIYGVKRQYPTVLYLETIDIKMKKDDGLLDCAVFNLS